jgi:leader peptidase (prepilin peptidase)/N-methyltransferase
MVLLPALPGWMVGVLLNALADSLPFERRLSRPACSRCGAPQGLLGWSGLVALVGGRRKCPYCGVPGGWRALAVELASLGVWVALFLRNPSASVLWRSLLVAEVFLLIAVIDLEHRLILHVVSLPAMLAVGLMHAFTPGFGPLKTLQGGVAGFGIILALYLLGGVFARAVSRIRRHPLDEVAFGFGDVTLAGVIGLSVGWPGIVLALFLGILAAGVFSLGYLVVMVLRRRYNAFTPIPYGPFLILGAAFVYFGGKVVLERLVGA